jgi:hypothetical protein
VFDGDAIEFIPERPQVTKNSKLEALRIEAEPMKDHDHAHFGNWIDAMEANDPRKCNNPPDLGAAAVTTVILGAQSYRNGVVYYFDPERGPYLAHQSDRSWAAQWEKLSRERGQPKHIPGWKAGNYGSTIEDPPHMALAGPWKNGEPPSGG